ncbi:MAG: geranylgeranyl reductase family protein, partial [Dehalococcoidia bacterium]
MAAMDADVIVVGAGPAGSTAAREIASRPGLRDGARVLLLDRARFPRDKPCGGGVTVRTARLLPFALDPVVEDTVTGARLRVRDGREVIRDGDRPLTYMTQRRHLDAFLVERAQEAGVEFRDGLTVRAVTALGGGGFALRTDGGTLRARVVIGADGANGVVADALGFDAPATSAVALEGNIAFPEGVPDEWRRRVTLNFGYLPGGYGWVFPKRDHINVGVGGWKGVVGKRLRPALDRLCRVYRLDPARLESLRGHHLPMQRRGMLTARGGAAVIGDAAGLVDPLSGEGIHTAVLSGITVADAVAAFLGERAPSLAAYHDALQARLASDLATSVALTEIFYAAPAPFVWAMQHVDRVWERCVQIVRGDVDYAEIPRAFGAIGPLTLGPVAALAR